MTPKPHPKCTCAVCSWTFSSMGDFNRHIASVHDKTHYPCQCGKVFSRKDVRLRLQRTFPRRSDSQSLQLDPCMVGEPTPKTSTIPFLPWLEANLQSGMVMSKTYDPHFRGPSSMQIVGPTLSGKTLWCPNWYRLQPPIFEMTLETVHVFDKTCTVTALPDNRCSRECNNTLVLPFTQEYQPSLGKKCSSRTTS